VLENVVVVFGVTLCVTWARCSAGSGGAAHLASADAKPDYAPEAFGVTAEALPGRYQTRMARVTASCNLARLCRSESGRTFSCWLVFR